MHYLLFYDYVPDYLERREAFRTIHLALAWQAQARGELVLAGVLTEPLDGAMFLFQCSTTTIVEEFVAADPYFQNGLVTQWRIRPWNTVVGDDAANPLRV
jgi:uncharacterized protein